MVGAHSGVHMIYIAKTSDETRQCVCICISLFSFSLSLCVYVCLSYGTCFFGGYYRFNCNLAARVNALILNRSKQILRKRVFVLR